MAITSKNYPEVDQIGNDLGALKKDTVQLATHLTKDGREKVSELSDRAYVAYDDLKQEGFRELQQATKWVKRNPGTSLACAFFGGVLFNFFLGSRR